MAESSSSVALELNSARTGIRGNNLDNVRRHNLSMVLGLVHARGAVSRAQLTRELGLNRSTIAALVAELVQLGLVIETDPEQTNQVGRPSLVIVPSTRNVVITVNPELDAVTIGLVSLGGTVLRKIRYDNVRIPGVREVVNIVAAVVAGMRSELDAEFRTVGVGLAIPGLVRGADGLVDFASHLGWRDEPIARMLQEATGFPVWAANDATCGAIAESVFGAGRDVQDMVYLNGGASGIGGGVISDGTLLTGANGYAGELGHTLVNSNGIVCHCGATGCLETEVSRALLLAALGLADSQAELLEDVLVEEMSRPDPPAELVALVNRQAGFLAVALRTAINVFNTQRIVLGGFLGALYRVAPDQLDAVARSGAMIGARDGVELMRASLGGDILMVGAAQLAFAELLADPASVG